MKSYNAVSMPCTHTCWHAERFEKGHHHTDLKVRNVVLPAGGSCIADKACEWLVAARGGSICGGGGGLLRGHVTVAQRGPCIGCQAPPRT